MLDHRHTTTVDWNLFQTLSDVARDGIMQGDGDELSSDNGPPRLSNLRSSTALSLNVFDPWVGAELSPVTNGLGVDHASRIRFEQKFPTGLRGTSPNLDVLLDTPDGTGKPTAIEVKFVEPYDGQSNGFRDSYFAKPELWNGLPHLKEIAEAIGPHDSTLKYLKAAQLIKHGLGLVNEYGPRGFVLVYLWFDDGSEVASAHRRETEAFIENAGLDIDVRSVTFQGLIPRLAGAPAEGYSDYLGARYGLMHNESRGSGDPTAGGAKVT